MWDYGWREMDFDERDKVGTKYILDGSLELSLASDVSLVSDDGYVMNQYNFDGTS